MRNFNFMVAGFCAASAIVSLMAGDYVVGGAILFMAVASYKIGGMGE